LQEFFLLKKTFLFSYVAIIMVFFCLKKAADKKREKGMKNASGSTLKELAVEPLILEAAILILIQQEPIT